MNKVSGFLSPLLSYYFLYHVTLQSSFRQFTPPPSFTKEGGINECYLILTLSTMVTLSKYFSPSSNSISIWFRLTKRYCKSWNKNKSSNRSSFTEDLRLDGDGGKQMKRTFHMKNNKWSQKWFSLKDIVDACVYLIVDALKTKNLFCDSHN